jgi:LPS-assembly lipoprotein
MRDTPIIGRRGILGLLTLATILLVNGCGFHPRGDYGLPSRISPVAVQGIDRFSPFYRKLADALSASGIAVASDAASAATVLQLRGYGGSQFVTAVDDQGKAAEYDLILASGFTLRDRATGTELVPLQQMETRRLFSQQAGTGFGKSLEREEIVGQLEEELADSIVRALGARLR